MEDKVKKSLLEAEKLVQKIKKKVKRNDLDYTIQYVMDSTNPSVLKYALRITPINEALGPITIVADTGKELLEKLQYRLDNGLEENELQIAYHESMVKNLENTIKFHKERAEALKKEEKGEE